MKQTRMQRRRPKRSHGGIVWVVIAIALVAAVIGVLFFSLNRKPDTADTASTTTSSSSKAVSSKSSPSAESSQSAEASSSESRTTDVQQFNSLSGSYRAMNAMMASLDFNKGEVRTWVDTDSGDVGEIDDVLQHSDGSLVIHVHFQGSEGTTRYLAYLFVPADVSLKKNWQTGAALTDRTDTTRARFSPGFSKDGGKNYDLSEAYENFTMSSRERSQYGRVLYYRQ